MRHFATCNANDLQVHDLTNYYTGLKVRAKKHFYGRAAAVMSFSEAFFALLPPLDAILRGDVEDDFDDSEEGLAAQEAEYNV